MDALAKRLRRAGHPAIGPRNRMLIYLGVEGLFILAVDRLLRRPMTAEPASA